MWSSQHRIQQIIPIAQQIDWNAQPGYTLTTIINALITIPISSSASKNLFTLNACYTCSLLFYIFFLLILQIYSLLALHATKLITDSIGYFAQTQIAFQILSKI